MDDIMEIDMLDGAQLKPHNGGENPALEIPERSENLPKNLNCGHWVPEHARCLYRAKPSRTLCEYCQMVRPKPWPFAIWGSLSHSAKVTHFK
jgi:hypothetical protein